MQKNQNPTQQDESPQDTKAAKDMLAQAKINFKGHIVYYQPYQVSGGSMMLIIVIREGNFKFVAYQILIEHGKAPALIGQAQGGHIKEAVEGLHSTSQKQEPHLIVGGYQEVKINNESKKQAADIMKAVGVNEANELAYYTRQVVAGFNHILVFFDQKANHYKGYAIFQSIQNQYQLRQKSEGHSITNTVQNLSGASVPKQLARVNAHKVEANPILMI